MERITVAIVVIGHDDVLGISGTECQTLGFRNGSLLTTHVLHDEWSGSAFARLGPLSFLVGRPVATQGDVGFQTRYGLIAPTEAEVPVGSALLCIDSQRQHHDDA